MNADLTCLQRYHQHDDAFAFQQLVQAHAGMVFATARRITQDAARAEEVAQETFLELARSAARVTESVGAWLHRVAWHKARDVVRADVTRRRYEEAAGEHLYMEREATWEKLEPLIDEAIEELPEKLRGPLVQHFFLNCSQQELAVELGVSQSTVSRLLNSGISELRSRLRSKHALCGSTLAVLLSANSTQAAPASLTASLGKLAISGTAAGSSSTSISSLTPALLAMNTTKVMLTTVAAATLIGVPLMLLNQGSKNAQSKPQAAAPPAKAAAPLRTLRAKTKMAETNTGEPAHHLPPPVSDAVRREVEGFIQRHQGMSWEQMSHDVEFQELNKRFLRLVNTPETLSKIEGAAVAIATLKHEGRDGAIQLGPTAENLGSPVFTSWVEAVVSNDPERTRDWVLNRLDGAAFEFGFDPTLEQTSDGVRVQLLPPRKPAKPDTEE
ncbi:sigma-70 family RNA polymerase sigma factor [Roseimicrobium sp. ORNL1]|uniref:RNA polymerase sigma factor n=1 Tax=Roseimicrobium sp. ORNL1 TaxID=2711231 RepID=UPI0013E1688F|nr:sigma-70 family RNA polymerase sigma factor [Roseimicrobium sp. ORNL1]QIF02460.1 sigma-70 family RNA polymerase sigma factor [Roseimicrobium sp. ORNL1]